MYRGWLLELTGTLKHSRRSLLALGAIESQSDVQAYKAMEDMNVRVAEDVLR